MNKKTESRKYRYDLERVTIDKDGVVSLNLRNRKVRANIAEKARALKEFQLG